MFTRKNITDKPTIQCINNTLIKDYHLKPLTKSNNKDIVNLYYDRDSKDTQSTIIKLNFNNTPYTAYPYTGGFFRCLIGGSSGSGKSTLCCNLLNLMQYNNENKLLVFYLSPILNDDDLDNSLKEIFKDNVKISEEMEDDKYELLIKNIKPDGLTLIKANQEGLINFFKEHKNKSLNLKITNSTIKEKPNYLFSVDNLNKYAKKQGFNNCCIVFDDCDTFTNKLYKKLCDAFMYDILERGRKHSEDEININCITIRHELGSNDNKKLYMECEFVYFNIQVIHQQRLNYICNKFNLDYYLDQLIERKAQHDTITCISTKYPFYFFTNSIIETIH